AFATPYAAGAIHPHSVSADNLNQLFGDSQAVFELLRKEGTMGIRTHRHYDVFETPEEQPGFSSLLNNFQVHEPGDDIPKRQEGDIATAFSYDMLFAQMPFYLSRLFALYEETGGTIHQQRLDRNDLLDTEGVLVNCSGYMGKQLFDDDRPFKAVRGHLVHVETERLPREDDGSYSSYNYVPDRSRLDNLGEGNTAYCFPRSDLIALGGTHQEGDPVNDEGYGPEGTQETVRIDDTEVPEHILALNRELLKEWKGIDISDCRKRACIGYRPVRDLEGEGIRIELVEDRSAPVLHNYGQGGSGITLSWGSALQSARLLQDEIEPSGNQQHGRGQYGIINPLRNQIQELLVS
ncbi:MAG: FAD-dependent oxidoreductase, partial [Candidatus Nanohaloarchaea archaeon]|nr:FAD-dependent oxidoreductase [Candidatus Nanohaloarchaea archaeon]